MLRVAAAVSGRGSTMLHILEDMLPGGSLHGKACMPVIIPSSASCPVYGHMLQAHPDATVEVIDPRTFGSREEYADALNCCFTKHGIDVYGQYGLVVKTPVDLLLEELIKLNQHPVPKIFGGDGFYGLTTHAAVLIYMRLLGLESMYSECITHQVLAEYDTGMEIMRLRVLLEATMTPEEAQRRAIGHEWHCQIEALHRICEEGWPLTEYPSLLQPFDLAVVEQAKAEALSLYPHKSK